ncbi:MAG: PAS domain S-box protein [Planctomycetes bacterium]|nr:PAS domain S-box protein [Planctomycetota bacterium]
MTSSSNELYSQIVDQTHSVIFIFDPDGKILFVNEFATKFFGYAKNELLEKNLLGTIMPERESTGRDLTTLIKNLTLNPEHYIYSTNECLQKNGDFVWVTWSNTPLYDENGSLCKILAIGNDITSRKLAEESYKKLLKLSQEEITSLSDELLAVKEQLQLETMEKTLLVKKQSELEEYLQHTEKLQAIGQLAIGIGHDFNNQLACIIGYADILLNRLQNEEVRHYVELILKAADRSSQLTAQLLNFARRRRTQKGLVNVHGIINDVVSLLSLSVDSEIEIRQFLSAEPPITLGDPVQLQNALLNLAVNARDAMPQGGQIIFTTERVELDHNFINNCPHEIEAGSYIKIAIIDTGKGISEDLQKRIFEPFFTTKETSEATGMGLSVVNDIVRLHKGVIDISSALDKGTTFIIYLPLADKQPVFLKERATRIIRAKRKARIMLIDDDDTARGLALDMLADSGYEVESCADGIEAIRRYRGSWSNTDLVILDMIMPKMSGYDTFLAMKEINPEITAIIASGHSLGENGRKILKAGVCSFLQKPYAMSDLTQQVAACLAGKPEAVQVVAP